MRAAVRLRGERSISLAHAILVYSDGSRQFATVHAPIPSPGGAPHLGPGAPLSTEFVRALAKGLGESLAADVLPPEVLVRTSEVTVWYRPATTATLYYKAKMSHVSKEEAAALERIHGQRVPIPALVFRATAQQLWVRALASDDRPTASTRLYVAPFYNVSALGGVCLGSMRRPHGRGLETLAEWERGFFESEFTHLLPGVVPTAHPKRFIGLWLELARRRARTFPVRYLKGAPKRETLVTFVAREQVGQL